MSSMSLNLVMLQTHLTKKANNTDLIAFAYFGQSSTGIYVGAESKAKVYQYRYRSNSFPKSRP